MFLLARSNITFGVLESDDKKNQARRRSILCVRDRTWPEFKINFHREIFRSERHEVFYRTVTMLHGLNIRCTYWSVHNGTRQRSSNLPWPSTIRASTGSYLINRSHGR